MIHFQKRVVGEATVNVTKTVTTTVKKNIQTIGMRIKMKMKAVWQRKYYDDLKLIYTWKDKNKNGIIEGIKNQSEWFANNDNVWQTPLISLVKIYLERIYCLFW